MDTHVQIDPTLDTDAAVRSKHRANPADTPILFAPNRHMGAYLSKKIGRDTVWWPGTLSGARTVFRPRNDAPANATPRRAGCRAPRMTSA